MFKFLIGLPRKKGEKVKKECLLAVRAKLCRDQDSNLGYCGTTQGTNHYTITAL